MLPLCLFRIPANIKHAMDNIPVCGVVLSLAYHASQLAFLVWLKLFCGDVVTWLFHARQRFPVYFSLTRLYVRQMDVKRLDLSSTRQPLQGG